ncbi:hypothetical protein O181_086498 [Austropuccinia psidii MF-1]|uniref:Uncharacterized protein n=1 Tax=Austropuccinia psidii MF-1 TaxID=1389203 RepID=A0A9Q3FV52_9BASI|nr:hypothetical protein [Austropuccinia psidii MF-1]
MIITLELYTRYHEKQKEKGSLQEKTPPATGSNSFSPLQDSSSKKAHHKKSEILKELKDFGEDVAISSLNLFQGDMNLPLLSFHASLEEKWDEEEEPEEIKTVFKVVPPTYHPYLDLFPKVKSEKLPPHHSCDHYIELRGH